LVSAGKKTGKGFSLLNLKRKSVKFKARLDGQEGDYSDFFTGTSVKLGEKEKITLEPWGYKVFVR